MSSLELSPQTLQDTATNCEKTGCCSTTEDGSAICTVSQKAQASSSPIIPLSAIETAKPSSETMWQKILGGVMFTIACLASPCCTPLIVPLGLGLIAGTPVALWLGQNLGWVYGGLTLLSVISFVLAFRWSRRAHA